MSLEITNGQPNHDNEPPAQHLRGLFTAAEVVTLNKWLPRFQQNKRSKGKKFVGFWEPLEKEFFDEHPLKDLTEAEIARGMDKGKCLARMRKVSELLYLELVKWLTNESEDA